MRGFLSHVSIQYNQSIMYWQGHHNIERLYCPLSVRSWLLSSPASCTLDMFNHLSNSELALRAEKILVKGIGWLFGMEIIPCTTGNYRLYHKNTLLSIVGVLACSNSKHFPPMIPFGILWRIYKERE